MPEQIDLLQDKMKLIELRKDMLVDTLFNELNRSPTQQGTLTAVSMLYQATHAYDMLVKMYGNYQTRVRELKDKQERKQQ